ncbi:hypothetical protein [Leucobacter sp. M11]|uniref:hypothetical protein n=1 Tax=Leucobacter sp. M11 TaxID=2993565 RepID=UPI002D7F93AC|nr:hypothetical protein [Leucobacter sp. M11]MEB4613460.1 hypothetical protein [Leucobacter sp. M11]
MSVILMAIVGAEIAFWVVLFAGLGSRYLLRMPRLSSVLLLLVPGVDLLLLTLISVDLLGGATAEFAHGLGAVYLGFTVSFGHSLIRRMDAWFAHRFAGGPAPVRVPKRGPQRLRHEWVSFSRSVLTAVIASAVILIMTWLVGNEARTAELMSWIPRVWFVVLIWFATGPLWEILGGRSEEQSADGSRPGALNPRD